MLDARLREYAGPFFYPRFPGDPRIFRPAEADLLIGDASKAEKKLGWKPKTKFKELVKIMAEAELALVKREAR